MNSLGQWIGPWLAAQNAAPAQGALQAAKGAVERLAEPDWIDIASPFFAFTLVIVVPSLLAIWVIFKTLTDKGENETPLASQNPSHLAQTED